MPTGRPRRDAASATAVQPAKANGNGANLGFEAQLFLAADKLRKNLEPSDYKHVALGLIFLKHISNAFQGRHRVRGSRSRPVRRARSISGSPP
jgi:type I restriction enzyme M protein